MQTRARGERYSSTQGCGIERYAVYFESDLRILRRSIRLFPIRIRYDPFFKVWGRLLFHGEPRIFDAAQERRVRCRNEQVGPPRIRISGTSSADDHDVYRPA